MFFYGAGCGTEIPRLTLEKVLKDYFSNAQVVVKEDTTAAVYATLGDEPGIVCVLGTGSNCCFSDGKKIEQRVVSLGYTCLLYTSPSPRDQRGSRMPSSA